MNLGATSYNGPFRTNRKLLSAQLASSRGRRFTPGMNRADPERWRAYLRKSNT